MFRTAVWFVAAGVLVTLRAGLELAGPVYWDPVSFLDYSAAILSTVAWVVIGMALFSWWRASPIRRGAVFFVIGAVGIVLSGIGNLLEDVFDMGFGELLYTFGGMAGAVSVLLGALLVLSVKSPLRWCGPFLFGFIGGSTFPDDGGEFLSGISLLGLGVWLLWSTSKASHPTASAHT